MIREIRKRVQRLQILVGNPRAAIQEQFNDCPAAVGGHMRAEFPQRFGQLELIRAGLDGEAQQDKQAALQNYPTAIPRRNSMLLRVFLSLPRSNSMASTGGTPVRARRRMTTLLYSSG